MDKKHNCNWDNGEDFADNRGAYLDYCKISNQWFLVVNDGIYEGETIIYVPITHCPFCGEELEVELF